MFLNIISPKTFSFCSIVFIHINERVKLDKNVYMHFYAHYQITRTYHQILYLANFMDSVLLKCAIHFVHSISPVQTICLFYLLLGTVNMKCMRILPLLCLFNCLRTEYS
jgi:hypothetical protein